jgi:hypothetical protein
LIVSFSEIGDCVGIGGCEIPAAIEMAVLVLCLIVVDVFIPFCVVKVVVLVEVFRWCFGFVLWVEIILVVVVLVVVVVSVMLILLGVVDETSIVVKLVEVVEVVVVVSDEVSKIGVELDDFFMFATVLTIFVIVVVEVVVENISLFFMYY